MKTFRWLAATMCVVALPALAAAQQTAGTAVQQTTLTPDPAPYPIASHWLVSGGLGSDFASDADQSVDFAGTAGWLFHGVIGGEFQANFAPDFELDPALAPPFLAGAPSVNSYMLNVIGAAPLMARGQFQPYVSGGPGWFRMHGTPTVGDENVDLDHSDTGWNAGFGLMGFLGQMGIRADLRYFRVSGDEFLGTNGSALRSNWGNVVDDQEGSVNGNVISGMSYWRGNVGVALRW